jgi:splicing suppressor protein 51
MSSRLITSSIRGSRSLLKASQLNKCSIHTTRANYFFSFFKKKEVKKVEPDNRVLQPDNLFHPWSKSPFQDLVDRDKMIKDYGNCPVCVEHGEHSHTQPKLTYECPDCGFTTHCSEAHYKADIEKHKAVCGQLKEINEDEHDLRSQRPFPEFQFPKTQLPDAVVNFTNWDTFFITRNFNNIEDDRAMRHVTKPLSYPLTIASVLHQYSPYLLEKGLTYEGVKSLSGNFII